MGESLRTRNTSFHGSSLHWSILGFNFVPFHSMDSIPTIALTNMPLFPQVNGLFLRHSCSKIVYFSESNFLDFFVFTCVIDVLEGKKLTTIKISSKKTISQIDLVLRHG